MKGLRISIAGLLLISLLALMFQPTSCAGYLTINKGCGSTYYSGELIIINYKVTAAAGSSVKVTLKDKLADGTVRVVFANQSISPNVQYSTTGVVIPPYGMETLTLEYTVITGDVGSSGIETCSFMVSSGSGGGGSGITSLHVESNVTGFQVYWDGHYIFTVPPDKNYVDLYNVGSGTHTITLKKAGCADASQSVTLVHGVENTVFIPMCGTGGGGTQPSDKDKDGVPDDKDACYNPDCNIVDSNGCPKDADRDGLNDCADECPTEAGSAADKGCPAKDRDSDGVTDDQDACYNPGCTIVDSQGCPKDTDGDGLSDCEDECPQEAGEKQDKGCPQEDADGDGVPDDQDNCYNPGCNLVDSKGCPWDSDGDGLSDCEDNCPNQVGTRDNNGCPKQGPGFCLGTGILAVMVALGGACAGVKRK